MSDTPEALGRTSSPKLLAGLLLAIIWFAVALASPVLAQSIKTKASHAILMDYETGAVLYQHRADELAPPASMSKLMTATVLFKALKNNQLKLEDEFLVSEDAWRRGGAPSRTSAMFVPLNTRVTLDELLQGIIVQSANDAAIAVAEGIAGSEPAFARLMETEARRIGLKSSTFRNATGLPHPEHRMTMRELALLARHLITEYPEFYQRYAQLEFQFRKHRFRNRNPLLAMDIGADGLKTGYTAESGYGLVGSAVRDGRRLIVVVNGLETARERGDEARKLLDWGFRSFTNYKLFGAGEVVGRARVWGGDQFYVPLDGGNGEVDVILPRFPAKQRLTAEIIYNGPLKPPIARGEQIAILRVTTTGNAVNEVPLYAASDVAQGSIIRRGLDSIAVMAIRWVSDQASGLIDKL